MIRTELPAMTTLAVDDGPAPISRSAPAARRAALALGALGVAVAAAPLPAQAETYYTGSCVVSERGVDGVYRNRTFQARINGSIEQGTGRYVWNSYDYRYAVDAGLSFGPSSNEQVTVIEGYVSGLSNPWNSPDSHGTSGGWIAEPNWKGVKSTWAGTKVKFYAAFDVPSNPDPHCTSYTARV